ncbi:MAG: hypothetical protein A2149_09510 [Candidatus Schekmanbacteria bacterium RBG_16_38_11]|uniref:Uncharacterized protein n=2 Tax=Candidatus Schekmaniibacteriota TaxID=1817811 RepID=A0A1F7RCI9_9BACT|nr:MAG: hypothetical protein A2042_07980 [Candidatus Schekmanbacteria bacterium GWA2_38_11]OGL44848.1 MAG: hypothetical protein A2149_09510 [Candidatus Schekmanbacteria bacterium RBG_16_38_11]
MSSISFKLFLVFFISINFVFFSGCFFSRINHLDSEILELKNNLSKIEKDRSTEKQQTETRLKSLEQGFKSNSSRIDELMQRTSITGGKVEEEQIREGK